MFYTISARTWGERVPAVKVNSSDIPVTFCPVIPGNRTDFPGLASYPSCHRNSPLNDCVDHLTLPLSRSIVQIGGAIPGQGIGVRIREDAQSLYELFPTALTQMEIATLELCNTFLFKESMKSKEKLTLSGSTDWEESSRFMLTLWKPTTSHMLRVSKSNYAKYPWKSIELTCRAGRWISAFDIMLQLRDIAERDPP